MREEGLLNRNVGRTSRMLAEKRWEEDGREIVLQRKEQIPENSKYSKKTKNKRAELVQ